MGAKWQLRRGGARRRPPQSVRMTKGADKNDVLAVCEAPDSGRFGLLLPKARAPLRQRQHRDTALPADLPAERAAAGRGPLC